MMEESKNQTEYKRSFVWSKPMVEMPPPKAEPLISNYQISYGSQLTVKATAAAAAAGASSGHSSLDHLDHHHPHHSHQPSKSVSSAESRSPTPGIARTLRAQDVASAISGGNALTKADNTQQQQQQHSSPNHAEQMGHGPAVLFSYEPPPRSLLPIDIPKQSEYHAKFKPFDEYVYVEGEGKFKKQTPATKLVAASTSASANGVASPPPASASKAWFVEVEERCKQACKYRARSQNGATPINPDHPWDGVAVKDRNLAALALATRLIVEEKKQERKSRSSSAKPTSRSSQARHQLNSAPASLRDQHSVDSSTKSAPKPVPRKLPGKAASPVTTTDKNNNVGPAKPPMAPKKAPVTTTTTTTSVPKDKEAKVWLKPAKKAAPPAASAKSNGEPPAKPTGKAVPKAVPKAGAKASAAAATPTNETPPTSKVFDSEPKSVPLRTTQVKSPEELTGIKSPSPESWKVSIEKGGLNWVNGNTPVNFDGSKTTGAPGLVKPVPINGSIK